MRLLLLAFLLAAGQAAKNLSFKSAKVVEKHVGALTHIVQTSQGTFVGASSGNDALYGKLEEGVKGWQKLEGAKILSFADGGDQMVLSAKFTKELTVNGKNAKPMSDMDSFLVATMDKDGKVEGFSTFGTHWDNKDVPFLAVSPSESDVCITGNSKAPFQFNDEEIKSDDKETFMLLLKKDGTKKSDPVLALHEDNPENACSPNPCQNKGKCGIVYLNEFDCQCTAGFKGSRCETPEDSESVCDPNPCGEAECVPTDDGTSFTCECEDGFEFDEEKGTCVAEDDDPCDPNPCGEAECVPGENKIDFTCKCKGGLKFDEQKKTCVVDPDYKPCDPNPCGEVECVPTDDGTSFTCKCEDGFEFDEEKGTCVAKGNDNPCDSDPCGEGECVPKDDQSGYTCNCKKDFEAKDLGEGETCVAVENPKTCTLECKNGGTCQLEGEKPKCNCTIGFAGDTCEDCSQDYCHQNNCTIVPKSDKEEAFVRCKCGPSKMGQKCELENPCFEFCQNDAECRLKWEDEKKQKRVPHCKCPVGFEGDKCEKSTAPECKKDCNGGHCEIIDGKEKCKCPESHIGEHCEDINMCLGVTCAEGQECDPEIGQCIDLRKREVDETSENFVTSTVQAKGAKSDAQAVSVSLVAGYTKKGQEFSAYLTGFVLQKDEAPKKYFYRSFSAGSQPPNPTLAIHKDGPTLNLVMTGVFTKSFKIDDFPLTLPENEQKGIFVIHFQAFSGDVDWATAITGLGDSKIPSTLPMTFYRQSSTESFVVLAAPATSETRVGGHLVKDSNAKQFLAMLSLSRGAETYFALSLLPKGASGSILGLASKEETILAVGSVKGTGLKFGETEEISASKESFFLAEIQLTESEVAPIPENTGTNSFVAIVIVLSIIVGVGMFIMYRRNRKGRTFRRAGGGQQPYARVNDIEMEGEDVTVFAVDDHVGRR